MTFNFDPHSQIHYDLLPVCGAPTDNRDIKSNWTNCIGTYILSNRTMNKYVGEFKNGQQNGMGSIVQPSGLKFLVVGRADGNMVNTFISSQMEKNLK